MSQQYRFITRVLRGLKRHYGMPISILIPTINDTNYRTGVVTYEESTINIKKAIILPSKWKRDYTYDLAYVAANKNFTEGGYFDTAQRDVIVDFKDVPLEYEPNANHRIKIGDSYYSILRYDRYEETRAILFTVKIILGEDNAR